MLGKLPHRAVVTVEYGHAQRTTGRPGDEQRDALRLARGERSLAEVARALETSWPSAKRLEDPRHYLTLKQLEKAAAALGKKLVLSFE